MIALPILSFLKGSINTCPFYSVSFYMLLFHIGQILHGNTFNYTKKCILISREVSIFNNHGKIKPKVFQNSVLICELGFKESSIKAGLVWQDSSVGAGA